MSNKKVHAGLNGHVQRSCLTTDKKQAARTMPRDLFLPHKVTLGALGQVPWSYTTGISLPACLVLYQCQK